jgi:hypothetical protein
MSDVKVSVKQANDVDATNAYTVTVTEYGETQTMTVHTNSHGNGLWINGQQTLGTTQFRAGKNAAAAIRRYFAKPTA